MAKAQVGDLIRITKVPEGWNSRKIGEIVEVTATIKKGDKGVSDDGVEFVKDDMGDNVVSYVTYDDQYEIHRKAGEEEAPKTTQADALAYYQSEVVGSEDDRISVPQDSVNSPNHYTQGRFETIEIIEEITQGYSDGYVAYCVGNALKYLARAPFKHGEPTEDISKAAKYIEFALARLQTQK